VKLLRQRLMARNFECHVAEFEVGVVVLHGHRCSASPSQRNPHLKCLDHPFPTARARWAMPRFVPGSLSFVVIFLCWLCLSCVVVRSNP